VDPVEETASLAPGGGTAEGESCSPQNGVVVSFRDIRTPLDPLDSDILYKCPRVDPHDGAQWGEWPVSLGKTRKLKVEISMFFLYSLIEEALVHLNPKDLGQNVVPGVPSLVSRRKMTLTLNYIYMKAL
jgi:hypothetical protein